VGESFRTISLSDYKGRYLVLVMYPLDWSWVCPSELTAFSDAMNEFRALDTDVVAISVDSKFSHLRWSQTPRSQGGLGGLKIPMVSDITKNISRDYGVLIEDGPDSGISLRGLFIIDPKGILRQITVNDLPVGRSVSETLRLIQAFKHTDKHGEVCPAGWKPGEDTIKPDPVGSLEWFSKHNEL
jgi:alkyl hydroperoxide reductase subunit AhpC